MRCPQGQNNVNCSTPNLENNIYQGDESPICMAKEVDPLHTNFFSQHMTLGFSVLYQPCWFLFYAITSNITGPDAEYI